ncbi:MAG: DGQHR domain-containing protein [Methylobacteriaceae bacterium]|nr:DGQHR domain-containing protein [Methylobacteriaceae bacterium]
MTSVSFPVVSVDQPIGSFFVGVLRADALLSICEFDYRRMQFTNGYIDFLGIQRKLNSNRLSEIARYVKTIDACFPTSVVISVDERCAKISDTSVSGVQLLTLNEYEDENDSNLSIPFNAIASIIDGQHRLKGLQEAGKNDFELSVSVFIGVDDATEATVFSIVNLAQTKVNPSLVYDLQALAKHRSPEKTCHDIVVNLDRLDASPFKNKIKRLGVATDGRFGETLSQATVVKGILPYITNDPVGDRDRGKRFAFWEPATAKDFSRRIFYPFFQQNEDVKILQIVVNYFSAVQEKWPIAWHDTGRGNMLNRTNGYNALIRFLRPALLNITGEPRVVAKAEFADLFSKVKLTDSDFNPSNFVPGTSGSTKLFRALVDGTGVVQ